MGISPISNEHTCNTEKLYNGGVPVYGFFMVYTISGIFVASQQSRSTSQVSNIHCCNIWHLIDLSYLDLATTIYSHILIKGSHTKSSRYVQQLKTALVLSDWVPLCMHEHWYFHSTWTFWAIARTVITMMKVCFISRFPQGSLHAWVTLSTCMIIGLAHAACPVDFASESHEKCTVSGLLNDDKLRPVLDCWCSCNLIHFCLHKAYGHGGYYLLTPLHKLLPWKKTSTYGLNSIKNSWKKHKPNV